MECSTDLDMCFLQAFKPARFDHGLQLGCADFTAAGHVEVMVLERTGMLHGSVV